MVMDDQKNDSGSTLPTVRNVTVQECLAKDDPLLYALEGGASLDVIKKLVEELGKELLVKKDKYGRYPLHFACEGGASLDVVKYLVKEADDGKGIELLVEKDNDGRYPLHCACHGAALDVVKYLV
eukprot:CAMPEP_0172328736 /NCGR_PEP_ID=MMETSP1058-20130122/60509_1 /TAXON_ID=83371 /ORGANISM="Detonula confervacea, Strain CCMP 353" /LENGTH=124 /DNA_ID=CAMNT_0013045863 /DNA_START=426 /DNA_END=796 /DNA_ORIENTATION=-